MQVAAIDARHGAFDWGFARDQAADIARLWQDSLAARPALFNGPVLLQCRLSLAGNHAEASYFTTDYASFTGWLRSGCPQPACGAQIRNGFAMGALRSRDGAYLLGVMGAHTFNAGKIYFAAGTPDPSDLRGDGTLDLEGSIRRELEEETGLRPDETTIADGWTLIISPERVACLRDVFIDLPAEDARTLMCARIAEQAEPELSDIAIVRSAADIDPVRMPPFVRSFLTERFAAVTRS